MSGYGDLEPAPVHVMFTPLFEAHWSYENFVRLMPFGPDSEGQAYAYSKPSRVLGDRLAGSYRTVQFPRWRADGLYVPDAHGLIETKSGDQVATKVGGYVIPVPGEPGKWAITHWMRFWTGAAELAWLNSTVAFGVGSMIENEAHVRYFAAAPTTEVADWPADAPLCKLLGTARWEYPEYESVRVFGDKEGVGFASSRGDVRGGVLAGKWLGWHYPTYLRNNLYQLDAQVAITSPEGAIVNRHAGLCTAPAQPEGDLIYDAVQYATFVTEAPGLAQLNRILAVGVGFVRSPGLVRCSYYELTVPLRGNQPQCRLERAAQHEGAPLAEQTLDEGSFDFWLGNWATRWRDAAGRSHRGTNVVLKLDQSLRELFEGPSKPRRYVGASVSEWDFGSSVWQQEYWDNSGYHAFFHGGWRGDRFILDQVHGEPAPNIRRRLVWSAVKVDSLLWDYELSKDAGQTWASTWHIEYQRD